MPPPIRPCRDEWIAILEFAPTNGITRFVVDDIDNLLEHLRDWDPTGLCSPDRYALQLRLPARDAHEALRWALAFHEQAAEAAGMPPSTLARVEILTADQFDRDCLEDDPVAGWAPTPVLCDEVYTATRRLFTAATSGELSDIVTRFVTAIGGQVEHRSAGSRRETVELDVSLEGDQSCFATAEALSVAGLIIEYSLPSLVEDARGILSRLQARQRRGV
jgi:hypothetical protein